VVKYQQEIEEAIAKSRKSGELEFVDAPDGASIYARPLRRGSKNGSTAWGRIKGKFQDFRGHPQARMGPTMCCRETRKVHVWCSIPEADYLLTKVIVRLRTVKNEKKRKDVLDEPSVSVLKKKAWLEIRSKAALAMLPEHLDYAHSRKPCQASREYLSCVCL
jgi:hypothetical protein